MPVYAVLTNEQLAAVAKKPPASASALREVEGIGEAKAGKYDGDVLGLVAAVAGETAASPGKEDKTA